MCGTAGGIGHAYADGGAGGAGEEALVQAHATYRAGGGAAGASAGTSFVGDLARLTALLAELRDEGALLEVGGALLSAADVVKRPCLRDDPPPP